MPDRSCLPTDSPRTVLADGWEIASAPAGTISQPDEASRTLSWLSAQSLGPVASILRTARLWNLQITRRFDAVDWWYRRVLVIPDTVADDGRTLLGFDGLATIADVWLNGTHLLASDNMFVSHVVSARALHSGRNELLLRFRSLDALLQDKRPRPRWRAPLVEHQQLRWLRTSLLGRLPGWSPPVAPVGPWRPIWLQGPGTLLHGSPRLRTRVHGHSGVVDVECELHAADGAVITGAELVVWRGARRYAVALAGGPGSGGHAFRGQLSVDPVALWWPHTHGEPALYEARVDVQLAGSAQPRIAISLGKIGFRTLGVDLAGGNFALHVNGQRIFCRGACWTPLDVVTLHTDASEVQRAIAQLAAAGMNMVRVGGTMVYESDAFLDACDAQGVLLWQDFMFANMDYPEGDAAFDASVTAECTQLLGRLAHRPCVAMLCGNSEVEQQAAMWGAPRERWTHGLFDQLLPELVATLAPDIPYWPSSAHGGAFPHQGNTGTTSYYGVGAYLRPLTDARHAEIRFATECLGIANVPEEQNLNGLESGGGLKVHSPLWKSRVPRDLGAGWDFDDVRDHYYQEIFGLAPLTTRYAQHDRYLDFSRAVSNEVMTATFREWRRGRSACNGALIWFLRDLWPGAGWGIVDSSGAPKSVYYAVKRLLQPRAVFVCDEGGNGLFAHVTNEAATVFDTTLEVALYRSASPTPTVKRLTLAVAARATTEIALASLFEGFTDLSYAYRFGPPPYEAIVTTILNDQEAPLGRDFYFPLGHKSITEENLGLTASVRALPNGDAEAQVTTEKLARFVTLRIAGFVCDDQYFHVAPGLPHQVHLHRTGAATQPTGEIRALNSAAARKIILPA